MFKLYTEQSQTFPFEDYGRLIAEASGYKTALEFGPGISTLALIEAGLEKIVSLEHNPEWLETQRAKFSEYPQVTIAKYADEVPVGADEVAFQDFDVAFVDSPQGFTHYLPGRIGRKAHPGMEDCSRLNTCLFALEQAPVVYLHDANRPLERGSLGRLNKMGHKVTWLGHTMARIDRNDKDAARPSVPGAPQPGGTSAGSNP